MSQPPPSRGSRRDTAGSTAPSWADLLAEDPDAAPAADAPPTSRREARAREAAHAAGQVRARRSKRPVDESSFGFPAVAPPRKRHRWVPWLVAPLVLLLVIGGGGAAAAFLLVPDWPTRLADVLAGPAEKDYRGSGSGDAVLVIHDGDIGEDVAKNLVSAGVTKTFDAFYDLLLSADPTPVFQPGAYSLHKKMSARSALDALLDPASRLENQVVIPEGETVATALQLVADATDVPLDDLQAAAKDPASFGLPKESTTLEGFLFPATYQFDPGITAHDALQTLVDRMVSSLDDAGVAPGDRYRVVTLASLVQKEAGLRDDYYKVSRVFLNRLDQDMLLQSDATVAYGTGNTHRVSTTDAERQDESNPYNTYVHPGLPVGPISNPGDLAIDAALHPADGPWLFFVTVDLETGQTVFSETIDEHDAAVQKWLAWMADHPEYQ
ncbi:MAG: hypothetical protein JWR33_2618 [Naasia sp.]|uniref:endolytic transglycosylase MltG n=1 Tax=Naasia sp. TaxID=2546198 RepID=UPI002626C86F|nr:endolytic transglycosylase MltG [Naasia sp.]MCU1571877.1 hypothetical protein [Naasia sp.]